MQTDMEYLHEKLAQARNVHGRIAQLGRELGVDRRTLDGFKKPDHVPSVKTVDKLLAHFRKADKDAARRAKQ